MLSFLYEKQTASPLDSYEMWINPRFPSKFAFKEHKEKWNKPSQSLSLAPILPKLESRTILLLAALAVAHDLCIWLGLSEAKELDRHMPH